MLYLTLKLQDKNLLSVLIKLYAHKIRNEPLSHTFLTWKMNSRLFSTLRKYFNLQYFLDLIIISKIIECSIGAF